jgi:uncharacterized protein (DUF58 family)
MIPAKRLYYLLLLGAAIALPIAIFFNLSISLGIILVYDLTLLTLAIVDAQKVRSSRVSVSRLPLQRLSIGRDNPIELSVRGVRYPTQILIRDHYPKNFSVSETILEADLLPRQPQTLSYTIRPDSRGEYPWGDLSLRQLGQWQLAWLGWKVPASQSVAVYPDLLALRSLTIRLALENTGTLRRIRQLGVGTEFAELKEYNQGDDLRLIDWKATARRNRPFVRVLEPEREQTLIVLLDRGRLMTARVEGLKRFDWGLNATLALALTGLHRGDKVGVGVFDREIVTWIPPARGQQNLSNILEKLTPIQPVLLEPDYVGAIAQVVAGQTRRALVVTITDLVDETASAELLTAMGRLIPRYLPFCVTLRDPKIDAIAHTATETLNGAYSRAVALDVLAQRQVALAQLKRRGVFILDAPANQISDRLIEQYLHLKTRNLL